jgi:hypothetical protein
VSSVVEEIAAEWLLDLFDLPRGIGVGLRHRLPDGELHGLAAARHGVLRRAGWDVEADGLQARRASTSSWSAPNRTSPSTSPALPRLRHGARQRVATDAQGSMRADHCARCSRRWTGRRSSARRRAT